MNKTESYETELLNLSPRHWPEFLRENHRLKSQGLNISLARAFARIGTLMDFKNYIRMGPDQAPANTSEEFLTVCGVLGFGQYLSTYHDAGLLLQLQERANDTRSNIRESVILALRMIAREQPTRFTKYATQWVKGSYWDQRAIILALSKPEILSNQKIRSEVFDLFDWATSSLLAENDQQSDGFKALKKTLCYSWAIAVVVHPRKGKARIERWIKEQDPVIKEVMKENLKQPQLLEMDKYWAEQWQEKISS